MADVDALTRAGQTSLMLACIHGHDEIVRILVEQGQANLLIRDHQGATALDYACHHSHLNAAWYLVRAFWVGRPAAHRFNHNRRPALAAPLEDDDEDNEDNDDDEEEEE